MHSKLYGRLPARRLVGDVRFGRDGRQIRSEGGGATNPLQSAPGSIRGDFATSIGANMVHGSDSPESAAREVGIFFPEL